MAMLTATSEVDMEMRIVGKTAILQDCLSAGSRLY